MKQADMEIEPLTQEEKQQLRLWLSTTPLQRLECQEKLRKLR